MQASGGLVEQVQRLAGLTLGEFTGEFDALGFAAGKCDRRLAEMHIAKADVDQGLQLLPHLRNVFEDRQCIGDRSFQHVSDRIALVLHRQRLVVVAAPVADLAHHVHVGQEIHFDATLAFSLAGLAASAAHVKRKAPCLVSPFPRLRQHGVEIADLRKDSGVSRRVRSWSPPDRSLIDANHLVDRLDSRHTLVGPGLFAGAIKTLGQGAIENVIDQRGFSRTAYSSHHRHHAEREAHVEVLEIVLTGSENGNGFSIGRARFKTGADVHFTGDVSTGQRFGDALDLLGGAVCD